MKEADVTGIVCDEQTLLWKAIDRDGWTRRAKRSHLAAAEDGFALRQRSLETLRKLGLRREEGA